jgi:hypothetical protein
MDRVNRAWNLILVEVVSQLLKYVRPLLSVCR